MPAKTSVIGMKMCRDCGKTKSTTDFHENPTSADGLRNSCKECMREKYKSRYRDLTLEEAAKLDRVQQFVRGIRSMADLDDDEVRGSFIRNDQGLPVHSHELDKKFQSKFTTELSRRLNCFLRSKAPDVVQQIYDIGTSDLVEPADRLKALFYLADRVMGKAPETLLIGKSEQPYEAIFEQLDGGSRDDYRQNQIENGNVVEAEVVEIPDDETPGSDGLDHNPLVDAQNKHDIRKETLARIKKAKQRRYAARAVGAAISEVPWFVGTNVLNENDMAILLDLAADGYQGKCAYRVRITSASELTPHQFDRMNANR